MDYFGNPQEHAIFTPWTSGKYVFEEQHSLTASGHAISVSQHTSPQYRVNI